MSQTAKRIYFRSAPDKSPKIYQLYSQEQLLEYLNTLKRRNIQISAEGQSCTVANFDRAEFELGPPKHNQHGTQKTALIIYGTNDRGESRPLKTIEFGLRSPGTKFNMSILVDPSSIPPKEILPKPTIVTPQALARPETPLPSPTLV